MRRNRWNIKEFKGGADCEDNEKRDRNGCSGCAEKEQVDAGEDFSEASVPFLCADVTRVPVSGCFLLSAHAGHIGGL